MIDLDRLADSEKVFLKEYKIYNHVIGTLSESVDDDILRSKLNILADEYLKLLEQAGKLVKISDSTQLKLRNTQIKLKEQNEKIALQNDELLKANDVQEHLLDVINRELSRASDYVKSILPNPIIEADHKVFIDWKFVPSSKLGGDMFGYKMLDDDNLAIYLLDVCGHGVRSALYSVSVVNAINYKSLPGVDFYSPASVFTGLNKIFDMREHNDLYFTMWYCVYNVQTKRLTYASAGHPPAILITKDLNFKLLESGNFFIGGVPNYLYQESSCILEQGDCFFIYSDGAYEVRKSEHEYITINELKDYLLTNFEKTDLLDNLFDYIQKINFDESLEDDFSIMKIKINI